MTIWVDPPIWPAHGTVWSHVISDVCLEELHAFAAAAGILPRSFEGDHYDVPAHRHPDVIAAGAIATSGRDLARRLAASGLRFRKRKGERPLGRYVDALAAVGGPHTLELVGSPLEPPPSSAAAIVLIASGDQMVLVRSRARPGWAPPGGTRELDESVRATAVREVAEETGLVLSAVDLRPVGYERIIVPPGQGRGIWRDDQPTYLAVFASSTRSAVRVRSHADDVLQARWFSRAAAREACAEQAWWAMVEYWRG